MATTHFSISRFYGARLGSADNLVPLGYAAEAVNVDTSDGALQTIVGAVPYPYVFGNNGIYIRPELLWLGESGKAYCIYNDVIVMIDVVTGEEEDLTRAQIVFAPESAAEKKMLRYVDRIFKTKIAGENVVIGLSDSYDAQYRSAGPVVIGYENGSYYVRAFGSGMFFSSDEIVEVTVDENNKPYGVRISRVMTDDEMAWSKYVASAYIMSDPDNDLDYIAASVEDVYEAEPEDGGTWIAFAEPLQSGIASGSYVKIRGGLSNQPVSFMATHYGRLFAGGDENFPNRLYWSSLPGDGRSVEDWAADDASPDTGGGYVQVGDAGYISGLFSFQSQLLVWKGDELWRLYGAMPSQYTLERVFVGCPITADTGSEVWELNAESMQDRIADVHGVPYMLVDTDLFYYTGNYLSSADDGRSISDYLRRHSYTRLEHYGHNFSDGFSEVRQVVYCNGSLYIVPIWLGVDEDMIVRYDYDTGALTQLKFFGGCTATPQGLLARPETGQRAYILLDKLSICSDLLKDLPDPSESWEDRYHYLEGPDESKLPIDAVWESQDLTFGEVSYTKKLRRIGMDVTGPIHVIVKSPEYVLHDAIYDMTDTQARRFLWIPVDMPYECSFRIRFESVDGHPFRIHNGVDFYIETNQRN
jgi:hypothetical protein